MCLIPVLTPQGQARSVAAAAMGASTGEIRVGIIGQYLGCMCLARSDVNKCAIQLCFVRCVRGWWKHQEVAHSESAENRWRSGRCGRKQVAGVSTKGCQGISHCQGVHILSLSLVFTCMQVLTAFLHSVTHPRQCSRSAAVVMAITVLKLLTSTCIHALHTLVVLVNQKQCLCAT